MLVFVEKEVEVEVQSTGIADVLIVLCESFRTTEGCLSAIGIVRFGKRRESALFVQDNVSFRWKAYCAAFIFSR